MNPPDAFLCGLCREKLAVPVSPSSTGLTTTQLLEVEMEKARKEHFSPSSAKRLYQCMGVVIGVMCLGIAWVGVRAMTSMRDGGAPGVAMITFAAGIFLTFVLHYYRKFVKR